MPLEADRLLALKLHSAALQQPVDKRSKENLAILFTARRGEQWLNYHLVERIRATRHPRANVQPPVVRIERNLPAKRLARHPDRKTELGRRDFTPGDRTGCEVRRKVEITNFRFDPRHRGRVPVGGLRLSQEFK